MSGDIVLFYYLWLNITPDAARSSVPSSPTFLTLRVGASLFSLDESSHRMPMLQHVSKFMSSCCSYDWSQVRSFMSFSVRAHLCFHLVFCKVWLLFYLYLSSLVLYCHSHILNRWWYRPFTHTWDDLEQSRRVQAIIKLWRVHWVLSHSFKYVM